MYCRKEGNMEAEEQVMLNVNELAKEHSYYDVGGLKVRPDKNMIAFSEDTLSRRIYTIRFKDLESGEILEERIPNTSGNFVWANDNQTGFYSVKDASLRSCKIFRHRLGTVRPKMWKYSTKPMTPSPLLSTDPRARNTSSSDREAPAMNTGFFPRISPSKKIPIVPKERGLEYQSLISRPMVYSDQLEQRRTSA